MSGSYFRGWGLALILLFFVNGCNEHSGHDVTEFRGDFRFDGDIGEFFDCLDRKKYFIDNKVGVHDELKERYEALKLPDKDDAYIIAEGYVKREKLMDGLDPVKVFVIAKIIEINTERGCHLRQQ